MMLFSCSNSVGEINIFACKLKDVMAILIQNHNNISSACSLIERSKKQD